jgi:hypothetical protein
MGPGGDPCELCRRCDGDRSDLGTPGIAATHPTGADAALPLSVMPVHRAFGADDKQAAGNVGAPVPALGKRPETS